MNVLNIVAHNLSAMYTDRQLGIVTGEKAKSSEKLASGYKINRAADDAAGLSISEKMRKRIRGLNQGAENLQDGVSLCQTADGALMEVEDMIHRMNELAIKAANGTNSQSDRQDINSEISELKEEMTRVFNTTKFNEIYIFKAPYVPDVEGEPTDFELFNSPDGNGSAGVLINNKRYSWDELGVPEVATGIDWIKDITDPDNPDELIRLKLKVGETRENIHRVYVMTADKQGIKVNNLYAGLWDSTIRENGKTVSFSYRGMDISIQSETGNRADLIDRLRGDALTETSWDAIPIPGDGNSAVKSTGDSMVFNVTNDNKNSIEGWAYQIKADADGVALVQTAGNDGLTHTKTSWGNFSNINGGEPFPISDWGTENEGNNPVTLNSSATYNYKDNATAGYYVNGMTFDFSFSENEVAKAQAITGLAQNLTGHDVSSPIRTVISDTGASVTSYSGFSFHFQRDKLLRDFGTDGASTPMTVSVDRTMVNESTVTDHEERRQLSEAYAKKMDHHVYTRTVTYTGIASVKFYGPDGTTELAGAPEGGSYDDTAPAGSSVDLGSGDETSFLKNTGLLATWTGSSESVLSREDGTNTERREIKDESGTLLGYADITFNRTTEDKKTTDSHYEVNNGEIINYVKSGDTYTAPRSNTAYVKDSGGGTDIDTDGNKYRTATDSESGQRYVETGTAWIATDTYDLDHYEYSAKNSGGGIAMTAGNSTHFLLTGGTEEVIAIHDSTGRVTNYYTDNYSALRNVRFTQGSASLNLSYTAGSGNRSNTVTVTPSGPATRTFTKSERTGGASTNTSLNVKVNPPSTKLELQAADLNLEKEREILEWTPLSNSILGLSNANTKTVESARATISSIEGALQLLNFDRSVFGAYQNRLEHAIKINDNTSENTQAAESLIRDTDMAKEMVKFSTQGILQQAGQSMLAQADQSNQGVLSLLK